MQTQKIFIIINLDSHSKAMLRQKEGHILRACSTEWIESVSKYVTSFESDASHKLTCSAKTLAKRSAIHLSTHLSRIVLPSRRVFSMLILF